MNRLALLIVPLALCQCVSQRPHEPPAVDPSQVEDRWEGRELERTAFADGEADGAADFASGSPRSPASHRSHFAAGTEQAYREGYNEGYDKAAAAGRKSASLTAAQQQAHDLGYAAGVRDRRMGRGDDPDKYAGTYDAKLSSWFLDGYHEGLEGR